MSRILHSALGAVTRDRNQNSSRHRGCVTRDRRIERNCAVYKLSATDFIPRLAILCRRLCDSFDSLLPDSLPSGFLEYRFGASNLNSPVSSGHCGRCIKYIFRLLWRTLALPESCRSTRRISRCAQLLFSSKAPSYCASQNTRDYCHALGRFNTFFPPSRKKLLSILLIILLSR
jgi:hypothetical protein